MEAKCKGEETTQAKARNKQWSMDGVVMVEASNELAMSRQGT
jgi:hypothetical protein